jgi:DNA-binding winged helix-turn-helix (wHTH) protein
MVCYRFGEFVLDLDAFVLRRGDVPLALQPKVLDVLRYLIEHRGRMVPKSELFDQIWKDEYVNDTAISWSVSHIRRALGQQRADKHPIETVHGRGYRFTAEVSAVDASSPPRATPASDPWASVLIGRERAMAELRLCVEEAIGGRGSLSVITGEAGIGKTRCADELAKRASAAGLQVLTGRCPQAPGTPPLWPIDTALAPLGERAAHARRAIAQLGDAADPQLAGQGDSVRFRTIEEVARVLKELATGPSGRPTLLVLDDIQWADAATLQLLGFIAPELSESALCIVAMLRDTEREAGAARDRALVQVLRQARTIPLGTLSSEHIAQLIAAVAGQTPSRELADAVLHASGGIPLFVQEVVRKLLAEHGEAAIDRLRPDAVRVPALARDVLRERIEQLPAASIEVLANAAVIGEQFELPLLGASLELEPEALLDRLAPAVALGLLQSEAPHAYRFVHSLFQAVLYEDLRAAQRVTIHRKLGELLAARADAGTRLGEIARHYYFSLAAGDCAVVVKYARAAGDAAAKVTAFEEAVLYYTWALEAQVFAGAFEPRARAELLLALAVVQRRSGRTGEATETAVRVIELAQQHQLHELVVRATRLRRPTVAMAMVRDPLVRSALELVLRQIPISPDEACIGALSQLACLPPYEPDLATSKELSARAVALAQQQDDREVLFDALRARLFSLSGPDDVSAVLQTADQVLALERTGPRSWQSSDARMAKFTAFTLAGRIADADAALAEAEATIGGAQWAEAMFYRQRMRAQRLFLDGRFDECEQRWRAIYGPAVRAGVSYADMMRNAQMLNLALEREGAKSVWHKYLSASGTRGSRAARAGIARIAAQAGELGFVRTQLSGLGNPADYPRDAIYLHTLASLSVCAAAIDDRARCEQLAALLAPYAELNTPDAMGYYLGSVAYFLGLLSVALGKTAQARSYFDRALERNREMNYRAGVVRTWLAIAELERSLRHGVGARSAFEAARAEAQALGMHAAAAEADAALARA